MVSHKAKVPAVPDRSATPTTRRCCPDHGPRTGAGGPQGPEGRARHDARLLQGRRERGRARGRAGGSVQAHALGILKAAVQTDGAITAVPWTRFSDTEATTLEAGCWPARCRSQAAAARAAHANKHASCQAGAARRGQGDRHARAEGPDGQEPYFEFLIAGGHKKNSGGIERGIIDIDDDRVFITAHYDKGSLAELVGVPDAVVDDWKEKVVAYKRAGSSRPADAPVKPSPGTSSGPARVSRSPLSSVALQLRHLDGPKVPVDARVESGQETSATGWPSPIASRARCSAPVMSKSRRRRAGARRR